MRALGEISIIVLGVVTIAAWTIFLPSVGTLYLLGLLK